MKIGCASDLFIYLDVSLLQNNNPVSSNTYFCRFFSEVFTGLAFSRTRPSTSAVTLKVAGWDRYLFVSKRSLGGTVEHQRPVLYNAFISL